MADVGAASGFSRYGQLLREPHVGALLGWSMVARLSLGMGALALLLLVRSAGGSYAAAGGVAAAYSVAIGIGAPIAGRQVDRRGRLQALLPRALGFPILISAVAVLGIAGAPPIALAPVAALAGALLPPVAASLRTLLPDVVPSGLLPTAFALEASFQEVFFVAGPLLVALLATLTPSAALFGAAVTTLVGTLMLLRVEPMRAADPPHEHERTWLGALASAGVRTLVLLAVLMGLAFGAVEVAMPAFAEAHGSRALGGLALACFSAGSLVGGLLTGLRHGSDSRTQLLLFTALLPPALVLPILAGSLPAMCGLVLLAGLPIAPLITGVYRLVEQVAPAGTQGETYAWFGTAVTAGFAAGSAAGGWLVDASGVRAAILTGVVAAAGAALLVTLRRGTLGPREAAVAPRAAEST